MPSVRIKRGTRAQIASAAAANGLKQGELYHVTDENRVDVGTGTGATSALATKSEVDGKEPTINAGTTAEYLRGDKTWANFATAVRATVLTGLSTATNAVVAATDSALQAIGKLQAQITGHKDAASNAHAASAIGNAPAGNISATTVQDAINELDSEKFSKSGGDITGDVTFTGTGRRIRPPFIGTPVGNRTLFQSSDANTATYIGVIPNGTAKATGITFSNSSDPDNAGYGYITMSDVEMRISSSIALGTGGTGGLPGAVPLVLAGRGGASMMIGDGAVVVTNGGVLGYGPGSGGTVTQTGSRTSGVTLNKSSGQITLVSAAGAPSWQSFTLTNSSISSTDGVVVTQKSGTDLYLIAVTAVATGSCRITFVTTGGTTTEQPVFNFQVVKGAAS